MNLREQYAAARKAAQDIQDKAKAEGRAKTDEEKAEFDKHVAEAQRLKAIIDQVDADQAALADLAENLAPVAEPGRVTNVRERRSPGDIVIASEQFQATVAQYPEGRVPERADVRMSPVRVGSFNTLLTNPRLYPTEHIVAPQELEVIDLFAAINVIDDAPEKIEIDRETFTNAAAVYTEGSDGTKAESTIVYTPDVVTLDTIAHHIPVTTRALKYNSILRNRIDNRLTNGVLAKAQAEVAATLLASVGFMQTQAWDTNILVTLRKAITKAIKGSMAIGGSSTIRALIAAEDHESVDLALLNAMVALVGSQVSQTTAVWNAEMYPVFGLPKGVAFIGDSKQIDFYVGEGGVTVSAGWVGNQFIQNRITLLGEMDAKAAVIGGAALVATDLNPGVSPDFS